MVEGAKTRARGASLWPLAAAIIVALVWSVATYQDLAKSLAPLVAQGAGSFSRGGLYGVGLLLASIAGWSLPLCMVVWLLMYLIFYLRRDPGRGVAYLFILWAVVFSADFALTSVSVHAARVQDAQERREGRVMANELATSLDRLRNVSSSPSSLGSDVKAKGDPGTVEDLSKQYLRAIESDSLAARNEELALGYPAFMSPQALYKEKDLGRTRQKLVKVRQITLGLSQKVAERAEQYRSAIQQSSMDGALKRSLIDGLNHGLAESAKNDRFATLLSLLSAEDQLVAELQRRRGRWVARNGAILFSTPADLAAVRPQFERTRSLQHEFQQEQSQARSDIGAAAEDMRQTAARDLADPHTP